MKTSKYPSNVKDKLKKIADYWEDKNTVSLIDKNLKLLELGFIKANLRKKDYVLDIGCGDGRSACYCSKFAKRVLGIDNSKYMIKQAKRFAKKNYPNVNFQNRNMLDLRTIGRKFDVVVTDRVITNLPTWQLQCEAILNVKNLLKKNGRYILLENFNDGYEKMNLYRKVMGFKKIPKHWHNTYLEKKKLLPFLKNHFKIEKKHNFNLYYFLTRIYTPMFASFTGYGKKAKSDPIFKKSDITARKINEKLSSEILFLGNEFLGPINGFVLIKK